jgi:hypothetical protein
MTDPAFGQDIFVAFVVLFTRRAHKLNVVHFHPSLKLRFGSFFENISNDPGNSTPKKPRGKGMEPGGWEA